MYTYILMYTLYTHVYLYTRVYSGIPVPTHIYLCILVYTRVHLCILAYVYSCVLIYTCVWMYMYTCVFLCVLMCTCICPCLVVFICLYTCTLCCFVQCMLRLYCILWIQAVFVIGLKLSHISPSQRKRIIWYIRVCIDKAFIHTLSFERSHWQWQVLLILSSYHECQSKRGGGWGGLNRVVYSWMWYTGSFACSVDYTANQLQCRNVAQALNLVLLSNQILCLWITNQSMLIGW